MALPMGVCDTTATAPTVAPALMKNFLREAVVAGSEGDFVFVLMELHWVDVYMQLFSNDECITFIIFMYSIYANLTQ